MTAVRATGRIGLAVGLGILAVGLAFAGGSALVAGDWWLAREPWIGIGLNLIVAGLALTALFALFRVVVEPIGWWRLLAIPPALLVAGVWLLYLVVGLPTTGLGGAEHDIRTILYTLPVSMALLIVLTLLVGLPLMIARARGRI